MEKIRTISALLVVTIVMIIGAVGYTQPIIAIIRQGYIDISYERKQQKKLDSKYFIPSSPRYRPARYHIPAQYYDYYNVVHPNFSNLEIYFDGNSYWGRARSDTKEDGKIYIHNGQPYWGVGSTIHVAESSVNESITVNGCEISRGTTVHFGENKVEIVSESGAYTVHHQVENEYFGDVDEGLFAKNPNEINTISITVTKKNGNEFVQTKLGKEVTLYTSQKEVKGAKYILGGILDVPANTILIIGKEGKLRAQRKDSIYTFSPKCILP